MLSASPYAVFKADDWMIPPAPIGLGQCVRVKPKKLYARNTSTCKTNRGGITKEYSGNLVQLAFA